MNPAQGITQPGNLHGPGLRTSEEHLGSRLDPHKRASVVDWAKSASGIIFATCDLRHSKFGGQAGTI
jgi:hypothetical protein